MTDRAFLDRPMWGALTKDLAALVPETGEISVAQTWEVGCPPGAKVLSVMPAVQLVSDGTDDSFTHDHKIVPLTEADWPAMYDLAMATQPGPYLMKTPLFGGFSGVKRDGKLIAMAGQRMQLGGHVEVSGICTDPAYQGQGLGTAMTVHLRNQILARGEVPFLHAYAGNAVAIKLYEALGFHKRQELIVSHLAKA